MGVAVLNSRDCLQNPLPSRQALLSPPPRMRSPRNPNPSRPNRANPGRRKRSPNSSSPPRAAAKGLVMEGVKILKRGEEIPEASREKQDQVPDLRANRRPEARDDVVRGFYAGSAFFTSPPPSSLPLPAFFTKKSADIDDATNGLRKILGLSLL